MNQSRCPRHPDVIVDKPPGTPILCPHDQGIIGDGSPDAVSSYTYTEAIPEQTSLFQRNRIHDRPDF